MLDVDPLYQRVEGRNEAKLRKLKDEWDLDNALLANGSYRHDEFALRFRLGAGWFGNVAWGYRQGDFERWNSSRVKGGLTRNVQGHATELSLIHVQSQTEAAGERFQGYFSEKWERGFVRPFAGSDVRCFTSVSTSAVCPSRPGSWTRNFRSGRMPGYRW